ncbi:MAG: hypothetical protein HOG03_04455 [Desulfobacula sp.]|jgi:hypothetical protein|uniref:hypothetical protein n=1 Tax=Desulfobacula sp. TaxID=2593537 RepID=UPI001D62F10A|nr:hypothetical protein [Desulfobacula sp.]MBT3483982.1 hypothetical protein [Desulfobacula sp.]MBT3803831.1 hypothetical protein [Desulfobacula sp.]MBT4023776.1 hypothetical protein [Desulfobacula sp.]MBT4197664.1 hypothetical protein [Desulfobacula sp.]
MLDIATAYNKYKFLGNDYLTWIWFLIETDQNISSLLNSKDVVTLEVGNSIVLENKLGDKSKEKITIKGDQAGLEEGTTALKKGAYVTQINLVCKINEDEYRFTIKGESLNITGLKTPKTDLSTKENEIEGVVLEKSFFCFNIFKVIDTLFLNYLEQRTADEWNIKGLQDIRNWIGSF